MKLFHHYTLYSTFNGKKLSANAENNKYTVGVSGSVTNGTPDIAWQAIAFIKETQQIWTHGKLYHCVANPTKTSELTNDSKFYVYPDGGIPTSNLDSSVQNALNKALSALQAVPAEYITETELSGTVDTINKAIDKKVDKVTGKGLSTNDFTDAYKTKLDGLSNYNDASISNRVAAIEKTLNTDTQNVIDSFNDIVDFLAGIDDKDTLDGIINGIISQIPTTVAELTDSSLYVKSSSLAKVATSGSYNDLSNKPAETTDSSVLGWGYSKGVTVNGSPKTPNASTGVVDLGYLTTKVKVNNGTAVDVDKNGQVQITGIATKVKTNDETAIAADTSTGVVSLGEIARSITINGVKKTPTATNGDVNVGTYVTKVTIGSTTKDVSTNGSVTFQDFVESEWVEG